jgi:hypothetical protein
MDFFKEIWKKEKFARGGLEERKKFARRGLEERIFFPREGLEERKICKRRFGKKNFPPRGGLEERKICKSFLEGRILQEELCNKQFREKLQRILQEGALEEDSRILQKKKKVV